MMRIVLLVVVEIFLFSLSLNAQLKIESKVQDEKGVPIPYANIGIKGKGIGTISDADGRFLLVLPDGLSYDTISISHISYESYTASAKEFPAIVILAKSMSTLKTVSVTSKRLKEKEIGNRSKAGLLISGFSHGDLGGEVGTRFTIRQPGYIEKVGFYIKYNSFDSVRLRINMYSIRNKLPHHRISASEFILLTDRQKGQIHHHLEQLVEVKDDIIVTLELVEHFPKNKGALYIAQRPPYFGKMYYRETSFDTVKKYIGGPMSMYLTLKYEAK